MERYDTINLVNNADFETEIFPGVYWVPFAVLGKSKTLFSDDLLQRIRQGKYEEIIQSPYEFIQYLQSADFQEYMDVIYQEEGGIQWEIHTSGTEAIMRNSGSCSSISGALYNILKRCYDSTGILCIFANSGVGHTVNYVYKNDFYYFVDPYTQLNKFVSQIPRETGNKKDFVRTKYVTAVCIKVKTIEKFVSFFEKYNFLKRREFLYFTYALERCPPISIAVTGENLSLVFPQNCPIHIRDYNGDKIEYHFKECTL